MSSHFNFSMLASATEGFDISSRRHRFASSPTPGRVGIAVERLSVVEPFRGDDNAEEVLNIPVCDAQISRRWPIPAETWWTTPFTRDATPW